METKKEQITYECKKCDFICSRKYNFDKHILTRKHKVSISEIKKELKCKKCSKEYKTNSGLWKHEKSCTVLNVIETNKELSNLLIKQQVENHQYQEKLLDHIKEQHRQIQELIPKIGNVTNFNITLFLNENCKEAVNWDDFIRSLELKGSQDIMKLIYEGIENLGIYKRPIHCLDIKRKKMCIKNENVWEHDRAKVNTTIHKSTAILQEKNSLMIKEWEEKHPEWYVSETYTEEYVQMQKDITMDVEKCNDLVNVILLEN
jgi:hypothetical protein